LVANRPESRRLVRSIIMIISAGAVIASVALALHLLDTLPK
jgi:hypothetical protein